MAHDQTQRGAHPEDASLFSSAQLGKLRAALHDYCWLLSHGYAVPSSLKLVGDRFRLTDRQRLVLMRSACTDAQRVRRQLTLRDKSQVTGNDLYVDGFNILITIESALAGGTLFVGQDGCYRDLASVHGTYRQVQTTRDAIQLIGETLVLLQIRNTIWFLDKPVSNSGRLRQTLIDIASARTWNWRIELSPSPDAELKKVTETVASTDSVILDSAEAWLHLNQHVIELHIPTATVIDLRQTAEEAGFP